MMNYWQPFLGQEKKVLDFFKPKAKGRSVSDVFQPRSSEPERRVLDYFKPKYKKIEIETAVPVGGEPFAAIDRAAGDPFAVRTAPRERTVRTRSGIDAWKPYPRMREGYDVAMAGPGNQDGTGFLKNPAFWLIAGVTVLIALEANGVTKLNSNA